jgi:transcriptional regulator with XRE-family HTH domain
MTTEHKQIRQAIAAALTNYRAENNLTQKQLAKLLHTNRSEIADIESHRRTPDVPMAIEIYNLIGISIYELNKPCGCKTHSHLR